ncbi:MAG TPA: STAS domain-containing protein [Actinomycetota bacterium]|nr:STAS domain-containing protein [Actinomycetota bacterium]
MATNFDMRTKSEDGKTIIELIGDLDFHTARRLRETLIEFHSQGVNHVTLDLTELEFIDSSGLSVLVAGLKRLRSGGGDLTLRSVSDQTRRVLEVSGLSRVLSIA